jgi:hypothetical protein
LDVVADVGSSPHIDRNSDLPVGRNVPLTTKVRRSKHSPHYLFDHLVGADEHGCWDVEAERSD